jgi:hypothetical protein
MSRKSTYYQLYLYRGKVTHEPASLSDAGSAGMEGKAYVMRVDNRARVTYAAATPAVRKVSGAREHAATPTPCDNR